MTTNILTGLAAVIFAAAWIYGIWKSIAYLDRRSESDAHKRRINASSVSPRAIVFYAFTVILFSGSLLGLVVSRPQAAVPLAMDSFLGSLILWFYVNNSTQSGDDLEPEIRSKLPTSVSALPIKISRVHWITNAPRVFLFGVIWIACSIASILIFDWRCIVMLCMFGVLSLMTHWMFSRLNYVTLKEEGIILAHEFRPIRTPNGPTDRI